MLVFTLRILSLLPLRVLHALGRACGYLVYALPGRYRKRLIENARQAGYDDPKFMRRAAAETGAMIFEIPKVWLQEQQAVDRVEVVDEDVLSAAKAEGRGILFMTPHLGCFEVSARCVSHNYPLTVMFREPRQSFLRDFVQLARNNSKMRAVPATTKGVREFVRALKRGEGVGMLPDQVPGQGEGVWAPVFGRPAYTVTLPGRLASQTKVAVLLAAAERLPKGQGWRLHFVRVPDPLPESALDQATLINTAMESLIRRFPEQYLWSYNRYKVPSGASIAPSSSGTHA